MHPVGLGHLPPPRDMRASRMRGTRGEERGKGISRMELDLGPVHLAYNPSYSACFFQPE
jgi:hypothetical protein